LQWGFFGHLAGVFDEQGHGFGISFGAIRSAIEGNRVLVGEAIDHADLALDAGAADHVVEARYFELERGAEARDIDMAEFVPKGASQVELRVVLFVAVEMDEVRLEEGNQAATLVVVSETPGEAMAQRSIGWTIEGQGSAQLQQVLPLDDGRGIALDLGGGATAQVDGFVLEQWTPTPRVAVVDTLEEMFTVRAVVAGCLEVADLYLGARAAQTGRSAGKTEKAEQEQVGEQQCGLE